jgi:hypothetical protein
MDGKIPVKITLSLILRWIVGLSILLLVIIRYIDGGYFSLISALFLGLIILIVLPSFADEMESIFNFRLSGPARFMLVIFLFLGAVTFSDNHVTSDITATEKNRVVDSKNPTASSIPDNNVCYYDWKWYTTDHIGNYNNAPAGSTYGVVTIYIKNKSDKSASTNPLDWYLLIDGLKYTYDLATFDSSINHLTYDVMKDAETETTIVYLVKGYPQNAELKYDQWFGPELKHIDHYDHSNNFKVQ